MSFDPKAIAGLFEVSRDAVLGVSQDKILFLNPAAASLFHAAPGDPASQHIPSYILEDPSEQFVASFKHKDRAGYISVSRGADFTLLSVILSEEDTPVPAVLTGAVQELSGALMATRLAADVILKQMDSQNEKLQTHSAILYQSYYRMKRLCEHIGKADSLHRNTVPFKPCVVAVDRLCAELCDSLCHFLTPMGISLEHVCEPGKYNTLADPALLETMFLNIITNSASHIAPGKQALIQFRLSMIGERIMVSIDDNGAGIPAKNLSPLLGHTASGNMTDPAAGAGLGLTVSRGIAELHGGALILESREDRGTKLRISLPVRLPEDPTLRTPSVAYNREGMDHILTELSVILDKKFYNKTLFD